MYKPTAPGNYFEGAKTKIGQKEIKKQSSRYYIKLPCQDLKP